MYDQRPREYVWAMNKLLPIFVLAAGLWAGEVLKVQPGQVAPKFSLPSLADAQVRISLREFADSARFHAKPGSGRTVLLSFWGTTCVSCRAELPRIGKWVARHPNVEFLPVLVEDVDTDAGLRWLQGIGIGRTGIHDRYHVVGKSYGVCSGEICTVPALFLIGPDQRVVVAKSGYDPAENLESVLDRALGAGQ